MACYYPSWPHHAPDGHLSHTRRPWPCGQCVGCRLERSRQWAVRIMHEAQLHEDNCFVTLTVNDEQLELVFPGGSLDHGPFQKFIRRLRKHMAREYLRSKQKPTKGTPLCSLGATENRFLKIPKNKPIRYYMAGEYGEKFGRPHFHACLFGVDFKDKVYDRTTPAGHKIYTSKTLEKLWPYGYSSIGELTFESAAYTARYIMKKQNNQQEKLTKKYQHINLETGEIINRKKEFNHMSRRPGLGHAWLNKYTADVYPQGTVVINATEAPAPRYYDKQYQKQNPEQYAALKKARQLKGDLYRDHKTPTRLKVQEAVKKAQLRKLKRTLGETS